MTYIPYKRRYIMGVDNIENHEIEYQIEIRQELLLQMVGNLYPAVLRGEIEKLEKRRDDFLSEREMVL